MTATLSPAFRDNSARGRMTRFIAVLGPGLVVMLADTDVGSIITAGQSGVQWGYRLLLLQLVLVPILFMVQELTVRLGIFTGRGHGELIAETFGKFWAWVSVAGLSVATAGALLTELSGVAGVGEIYGVPRPVSLALTGGALLLIVLTGSYRRVERAAIALGLFELAFFGVAWAAHPKLGEIAAQSVRIPIANKDYLYLVAANIGAVIMPWMVFYQQSAVADKKLKPEHFNAARVDTALGAVLTQLVMAAVLVAAAATLAGRTNGDSLKTVGDLSSALTAVPGRRCRQVGVRAGHHRRGDGRGHRCVIGAGLGAGRGHGVQALARISTAGGALVLRRLRRQHRRGLRAGRGVAESGFAQSRRSGDERLAAADRAGLPDRLGGEGVAGKGAVERLVSLAGDRGGWGDLRAGGVWRADGSCHRLINDEDDPV